MDRNPDNLCGKKSFPVPPDLEIDDIVQSIEKVDREIERFYKIHGTELKGMPDEQAEFGGD